MKTTLASVFLIFIAVYISSYIYESPLLLQEIRTLIERVFLYVYFISLGILSIIQIASAVLNKDREETTSSIISKLMAAHMYATRIVVFILIVGFPALMYFNISYTWELSDSVIIAIPTIILAMLVAEQNLYSFAIARTENNGMELAALASVRQVVNSIYNSPKKGIPDKATLAVLERSLELLQQKTHEANFSKFATQAILTLHSIRDNEATEIWQGCIEQLYNDLHEDNIK